MCIILSKDNGPTGNIYNYAAKVYSFDTSNEQKMKRTLIEVARDLQKYSDPTKQEHIDYEFKEGKEDKTNLHLISNNSKTFEIFEKSKVRKKLIKTLTGIEIRKNY